MNPIPSRPRVIYRDDFDRPWVVVYGPRRVNIWGKYSDRKEALRECGKLQHFLDRSTVTV